MKSIRRKAGIILQHPVLLILLFSLILYGCATTYKEYDVAMNAQAHGAEELMMDGDYEKALAMYQKAMLAYEREKKEAGVLPFSFVLGTLLHDRRD